jgi:DNA-directed RNA polymerase subunit RPC12/RpoP
MAKKTYSCYQCSRLFDSKTELCIHNYDNNHCEEDPNLEEYETRHDYTCLNKFACPYCKEKIFNATERINHINKCELKDYIHPLNIKDIDESIKHLFCTDNNGDILTNIDLNGCYINTLFICERNKYDLPTFYSYDPDIRLFIEKIKKENPEIKLLIEYDSFINPKITHTYIHKLLIPLFVKKCCSIYGRKILNFVYENIK